ncbi:ABC transporter [Phytophthora megakarya]|uniref:ABC transporter n=1 Tax=Phytophthora megakarya TaxID=4795 RepID=A0A225V870_9STRA|nr:ABC transporter [Phytophthora megakarya]
MQDDLFYQTITVKEHLVFQAKLRMGKTFTEKQYMARVDEVMEELGLMKCRDTLIGGISLRGISGGERKRLSFATEILTNPSILFVDEPTSGLDSFMAETVVMQLQQIARCGRTVIATIHQPSSELFALFDQLYLLSDGAAVYHGKAAESVDYFASLGYPCPSLMNPTDYFMRQLVVMDKATDEAGVTRVEGLKEEWLKHQTLPQIDHEDFLGERQSDCLFEDSRLEWIGQIVVLVQRNVIRFVRDRFAFHAAIFQTLFVSLVVGLIFLQLDLDQDGIQNFTGGFFFLVVNQTFASANPTFISVPMELPIIIREYKSGLYHLFSWYFSKNVSEFPMQVLLPILFFVPVYFLMGIGHGIDVFIYMQIIVILVNSCAIGLGYMVSCLCRRVDIAPIIGVVIILPFLLFGGLLINSDDCPDYFIWVQYISPIKYGFEALMKIFWRQVSSISCNAAIENCTALTGDEVLKNFSMESRSAIADGAILIAINLGFRAPWSDATKRFTSYVMQDDLFYQTITVKEHLVFQAKLRMGKTFTEKQYMARVDEVMEELGLMKCRDTLIGGISLRGISGGERKRLSFATEILTNPSILFVDEPTSGLDSFMAETVVMQLQQIARDGRTVIATIHQPSSEVFALFDQLYLLSDGAAVYQGKALASVDYFSSLGYACPPMMNPTDYFMKQLVVMDKATDAEGVARVDKLKKAWTEHLTLPPIDSTTGDTKVEEYQDSRLNFFGQIGVLAHRNVVRFVRDRLGFRAAIFQTLIVSLIVGLIFLQLKLNQKGIQNFTGGFFFLVVNQTFGSANPIFISVPMELPIIIREYRAGLYALFSWYLSKNMSEIPMQILLPIVFFVPAYLLMGIGHGFDVFIYQQIIMILVNSCAVGLGYMVSCLVRRVDIAPIIGMIIILPFMLFGGLLINSDDCPKYFIWIQYVSPIKYGFEAMMKIFWEQVPTIACNEAIENCTARTGADVLKNFSLQSRSALGDGLILLAINFGFRAVGFICLWLNLRKEG